MFLPFGWEEVVSSDGQMLMRDDLTLSSISYPGIVKSSARSSTSTFSLKSLCSYHLYQLNRPTTSEQAYLLKGPC